MVLCMSCHTPYRSAEFTPLHRVRQFRQKNFSLQSETRSVSHAFRTLPQFFFFFAAFSYKFLLPTKAKLIQRISLCFASKIFSFRFEAIRNKHFFASFSFTRYSIEKLKTNLNIFLRFFTDGPRISLYPFSLWSFCFFFGFFASFHFRFASDAKKHFFRIEVKKISLPFRFILLRSKNDGSFRFVFVFFSLHFVFVSPQISIFRIDAKQAKISLPFRFISLRSAPYLYPWFFRANFTKHARYISWEFCYRIRSVFLPSRRILQHSIWFLDIFLRPRKLCFGRSSVFSQAILDSPSL